MMRTLTLAAALAAVIALPASAEDVNSPSKATSAPSTQMGAVSILTTPEAQAWVGKPVYSSDGSNLGEVASIMRSADNKITELRAEIGGFLGIGQHEISVPAAQFSLQSDRVVLDLTAAAAKQLPKVSN